LIIVSAVQNLDTIVIPEAIRQVLPRQIPIYLVGGAVRDALVGRKSDDLDFVLPEQALKTARMAANSLRGDFYVLDDEREIGRVIIEKEEGGRQILDFALQRSSNLEGDLKGRDFTINAMAIDLNNPLQLIDPLGGSRDLHEKLLKTCSASSIKDDPVRILRAIRMATLFKLRIQPDTLLQIRQSIELLNLVSAERIRDELYRLLEAPGCATSIRVLDQLGVIERLFPEIEALKHASHEIKGGKNQWEVTLDVLKRLEILLAVLSLQPKQEAGNNLMMGLVTLKLGRYRIPLNTHLSTSLTPGRTIKQTLYLAALFHRLGEANPCSPESIDVKSRLQVLCLGNQEIDWVIKIIANYSLDPTHDNHSKLPDRREIYRYFRCAGEAGIDAGLLYLADRLVTGGLDLSAEEFTHSLSFISAFYEAWWELSEIVISPVLLVNGDDLMNQFKLSPGPLLGKILSEIKEAQAAGEVNSKEEAYVMAENLIKQNEVGI
jgi:poly(A) polymerase